MFPTPAEQTILNPHNLNRGDRVILPNGTEATLIRAGFRWGKASRYGQTWIGPLADLRPIAAEPIIQQLALL